jgi:hypothetical protein
MTEVILMAKYPTIDISQIAGMFERFEGLKQSQARQFIDQFANFIPRFVEVQKNAELTARKNAPDFNIFRFLVYERKEELHSRFISYLLNPRESHDQGHLFLEHFLENLRDEIELPLPNSEINQGVWLVQREVFSQFGRLDMVLRNKKLKTIYVLENKVDAYEQENQIERYGIYIQKHHGQYPIHGLLFLTTDGHSASSAGKMPYFKISYRQTIQHWLERVIPTIEAGTVRETVRQYLTLVKDL